MSKYGMTKEEFELFKGEARFNPPEDWVTYGWVEVFDDYPETKNFPSEKVAKAYFSALQITDFYKV